MKRKHQCISETPLVADLSLIVTSTLANQRLCSSVTACDDGVASPVEYAFACAFFPCCDGIRIPKESAAIFENGSLTRADAAKQLQAFTGASRASCYRALGRFGKRLRDEDGMLAWRH